MFAFLKGRRAEPDRAADAERTAAADVPAGGPAPASGTPPDVPAETPPAPAATGPTSAAADHPLAAMVWDSPDVPRDEPPAEPAGAPSHGLDVGALVAPSETAPGSGYGPADQDRTDALKPLIVEALSTIYDPEIPVNIYELGLIYEIVADAESRVTVTMTLTSPACPAAQQLPSEARYKTKAVEGVTDAYVDVVWEPPWTKDMMSETAKLALGMF